MNKVILHLGSNKGNRLANLIKAQELINVFIQDIDQASAIYETEAWGIKDQPDFLNQVLVFSSYLSPFILLKRLQKIETIIGKEKDFRWGPRYIDIDILFYGNSIIDETNLTIPHPHLKERRFVLIPLAEVAPDFIHPISKTTIAELLDFCEDDSAVNEYNEIHLH